jgi:hypothetical protein
MAISRRSLLQSVAWARAVPAEGTQSGLDPKAQIHLAIGIPDSLDTLKTFVEAEGNFSPGAGTHGVYFWLMDAQGRITAPTQPGVPLTYGLSGDGALIPWSRWEAAPFQVTTAICQVQETSPLGEGQVVAARAEIVNRSDRRQVISLLAVLRPLGAAGGDVRALAADVQLSALLVDGHPAIVADRRPDRAVALPLDAVDSFDWTETAPPAQAQSPNGDCSGALRFDLTLAPHARETLAFVCPVLPGRPAARHRWVDLKQNAMADMAELRPDRGGVPQPDPGTRFYRSLQPGRLFRKASAYWTKTLAGLDLSLPDPRWPLALRAIAGHAAMCLNEGAPDVAVLNYNVFNRDGMYIANIMQKCGLSAWSEAILDYFLAHPFNGRAYPEADNPGQILWAIEQHWLLSRDVQWRDRLRPAVLQLARLVEYYRCTPGPHWVSMNSLDFGEALPAGRRQELKPGRCDGFHPEYTEAFDISGLKGAATFLRGCGDAAAAGHFEHIAAGLTSTYQQRFGQDLRRSYGSYCVLWPCRLYPLGQGPAHEQFRQIGAQTPSEWRYFALATAHQGLLAGNRQAAYATLSTHLDHPQMRHWYVFDEGGGSGSGTWRSIRTNWRHSKSRPGDNLAVAMPHGWAIAELWHLMRDSLVFEEEDTLVLLAGVPPEWFRHPAGMRINALPTHFGPLTLGYSPIPGGARLTIAGSKPPKGFRLRLPREFEAKAATGAAQITIDESGTCVIPPGAAEVLLRF